MRLHAKTNSLLLRVDDPFEVRDLIPDSRIVPLPDANIAVRYTDEAAKVLTNIGVVTPLPGMTAYKWPGKFSPMAHQRSIVDFYLRNNRCFNLSEMGCGKSAASLWAADILMLQGKVEKCVVFSPLSTLERVWVQELFDVLMHRRAVIVHGSLEKRKKALATKADFYIVNHDGVGHEEVRKFVRSPEVGLVIVDEGSMFRNGSTMRHKALEGMLKTKKRVWWLTGTPCPNAPTDAWAQARIVNPSRVPLYFGRFKRDTMMQVTTYKWAPRAGSEEIAFDALQPAIRILKKDCMDLPPMTHIDLTAELTVEQKHAIKTMKDDMIHMRSNGQTINAVNAADKLNKLRQIMCGSLRDTEKEEYVGLPHAPRLRTLLDAIDMAHAKAIVIAPFKGIARVLETELLHAGHTVGVLNGDVSPRARNDIIRAFKNDAEPNLLLCHPQVMSHGLNLTEADVLVFYAPIYSNDQFQQVVERINRAGQVRPMTVVRIGAHPVEWEIYRMVDKRAQAQDAILRLYDLAIAS